MIEDGRMVDLILNGNYLYGPEHSRHSRTVNAHSAPGILRQHSFFLRLRQPVQAGVSCSPALLPNRIPGCTVLSAAGAVCAARLQRAANGMAAPCAAFLPIQTMICVPGVLHASFL